MRRTRSNSGILLAALAKHLIRASFYGSARIHREFQPFSAFSALSAPLR
jgi:hypothetical protein